MTTTPDPINFQEEVLSRFDRLEQKLDGEIQRVYKWEERFLQLSRDNLAIARTVIIAAATVVIFGSLLDQADVFIEGTAHLLGK